MRGDIVFRDGFAVMGLRPEAVTHLKQVANEIACVHLGDTALIEDLPNVLQKGDDFIDLGRVGTRLTYLGRRIHRMLWPVLADKLCDLAQRIPVVAAAVEQGLGSVDLRQLFDVGNETGDLATRHIECLAFPVDQVFRLFVRRGGQKEIMIERLSSVSGIRALPVPTMPAYAIPVKVGNLTTSQPPLGVFSVRSAKAVDRRWPEFRTAFNSGWASECRMLSASSIRSVGRPVTPILRKMDAVVVDPTMSALGVRQASSSRSVDLPLSERALWMARRGEMLIFRSTRWMAWAKTLHRTVARRSVMSARI